MGPCYKQLVSRSNICIFISSTSPGCIERGWGPVTNSLFQDLIFVSLFPVHRQAVLREDGALLQTACSDFKDVLRRFPNCSDGYTMYGQVCTSIFTYRL